MSPRERAALLYIAEHPAHDGLCPLYDWVPWDAGWGRAGGGVLSALRRRGLIQTTRWGRSWGPSDVRLTIEGYDAYCDLADGIRPTVRPLPRQGCIAP